jgi:hypothetical protein
MLSKIKALFTLIKSGGAMTDAIVFLIILVLVSAAGGFFPGLLIGCVGCK